MNELAFVAMPIGLGVLITALLGVLKYFNVIPDGKGGLVSLVANTLVLLVLTVAVEGFAINIKSEQYQAVFEILGFAGQALLVFMSAFATQKVSKEANISPASRFNDK